MSSPVPNLPPISAIQDPNVRSYLEALTAAWNVRNGQVGNGDEKFLTVKDLKEGIGAVQSGGAGGSLSGGGTRLSSSAATVASMIRAISDDIQQSRLWKVLGTRLDTIEMPEWFKGKVGAEIQTEIVKVNNATNALASQTTTAITNINNNVGVVQTNINTVSTTVSATAGAVTDLQAGCGYDPVKKEYTTLIRAQQAFDVSADVDGKVKGTWAVKFDTEGYVTGVGLGIDKGPGGSPRSAFFVRADQFAVGPPTGGPVVSGTVDPETSMLPFIVSDGKVYINDAYLKKAKIDWAQITNAEITTADIVDASVSTLKIAGGAVTVNRAAQWTPSWVGQTSAGPGTWVDPYYSTADSNGWSIPASGGLNPGWISPSLFVTYELNCVPELVSITISVHAAIITNSTNVAIGFRRNGVILDWRSMSSLGGFSTMHTVTLVDTSPVVGNSQYQVVLANDNRALGNRYVPWFVSAVLMSGKR